MKVFVISPLFPDVQLELGESDIQRGITFKELWSGMDSLGVYCIDDLEVERCELETSIPDLFQLSTPLYSVASSSAVFSIDLRVNKIHFHYRADPITNFDKYGSIQIAKSEGQTAFDFMKYVLRRHSLLLGDGKVDFENTNYKDLILKAAYKDANPHYFLLSDYWMRDFDKEGLVRIEIIHSLKIPEGDSHRSIKTSGRLLNSSSQLSAILYQNLEKMKYQLFLDENLCEDDMHLVDFFRHYHRSKIFSVKIDVSTKVTSPPQTEEFYKSKAAALIKSEKWKDFFSQMKVRLAEYASVQIVWPHKSGKTQMAYNLSCYYKVIYIDYDKNSPLTRLVQEYSDRQWWSNHRGCASRVYTAIWNGEGTISDVINKADYCVGIFGNLMQYLEALESFDSEIENLDNWLILPEQVSRMSIAEFQAKYLPNILSKYIIFMDHVKCDQFGPPRTLGPIKLLAAILGIKVVTAGVAKLKLNLPPKGLEIKKWCSIVRLPITFVREISDTPFDEEILLHRVCHLFNGNDATKRGFFYFMMKQIDSSVPGDGQLLARNYVQSLDFVLKEGELMDFDVWRDGLVQKILYDMHDKYHFYPQGAVNTLLNPWYFEPPNHYFSLLVDESSMSGLSSAQFVDFDVQEDNLNARGGGEGHFTQDKIVTPSDIIPWDTNVFQYIYLFPETK